jgi:hypothetical protein
MLIIVQLLQFIKKENSQNFERKSRVFIYIVITYYYLLT